MFCVLVRAIHAPAGVSDSSTAVRFSADWLYLGAGATLDAQQPNAGGALLRAGAAPAARQNRSAATPHTHAAAAAGNAPKSAAPRRHNTDARRRSRDDGLLRRKFKGHGRRLVSR